MPSMRLRFVRDWLRHRSHDENLTQSVSKRSVFPLTFFRRKHPMSNENLFQTAVDAAKKAGCARPEVIAEYLLPDLTVEDTQGGPTVFVRNGMGVESLPAVFARLAVDAEMGPAVNGGQPDAKTITPRAYRAYRKHAPEVFGLRQRS